MSLLRDAARYAAYRLCGIPRDLDQAMRDALAGDRTAAPDWTSGTAAKAAPPNERNTAMNIIPNPDNAVHHQQAHVLNACAHLLHLHLPVMEWTIPIAENPPQLHGRRTITHRSVADRAAHAWAEYLRASVRVTPRPDGSVRLQVDGSRQGVEIRISVICEPGTLDGAA